MAATDAGCAVSRIVERIREPAKLRTRENPVSRFLAGTVDAACRIRVLRTPLQSFGQGEQPRHQCQGPVALRRGIRHPIGEAFDVPSRHFGDAQLAETRSDVLADLLPVLRHCALAHASGGDAGGRSLVQELLDQVVNGRRLSRFPLALQRVCLPGTDAQKLLRGALAHHLELEPSGAA